MALIRYNELKQFLSTSVKEQFPPVFLLYGEEFLYKTALEDILHTIIPISQRNTNYEPIEGTIENYNDVIEKLNTFSLIPGHKAILMQEAKIFYSTRDIDRIIEKAKSAYDENNYTNASKNLIAALQLLQLSFDDITSDDKNKKLHMEQNSEWIRSIVDYCIENNLTIPDEDGNTKSLEEAIKNGFPKHNHLIVTTDTADKNHSLFKMIVDKGMVVDCSVPKSDRAADKKIQQSVSNEKAKILLQKHKKTMGKNAANALYEMTGFDLRTFTSNLEKLISYVGDREEITENEAAKLYSTEGGQLPAWLSIRNGRLRAAIHYYNNEDQSRHKYFHRLFFAKWAH